MPRARESAKTNTTGHEAEYHENKYHEDKGCEASPSCLTCPLPQCKHDDPSSFLKFKQAKKDLSIFNAMQAENLTVEEAAERFSTTTRTVLRILRRSPEPGAEP